MISRQIEARGIKDPLVLAAMREVPRHVFVPAPYRLLSYHDRPLPIGFGQTISQPYMVALMTELLVADRTSTILEIGTGSGYQAAILSKIVKQVYSIEINEQLSHRAAGIFRSLELENISLRVGDGYLGWSDAAPFSGIIVTCSPSHVPETLTEQLAENGRLIIPVGTNTHQRLLVFIKENDHLKNNITIPVRFVPMLRKNGERY